MAAEKQKKTNKDLLQSPKGMRDILGAEYYEMQGFFEKGSRDCYVLWF